MKYSTLIINSLFDLEEKSIKHMIQKNLQKIFYHLKMIVNLICIEYIHYKYHIKT